MEKQDLAILYSGGPNSLALYALAMAGHHPEISRPHTIHLLHMLNGMGRFHSFPQARYQLVQGLLERQLPRPDDAPETNCLELDMGRLFQGLWLNRYEELMPRFGGKNLVCVACNLGMYAKGVLYCINHHVPQLLAGHASSSTCCPKQADVFMERIAAFSTLFGITTKFPLYGATEDGHTVRHLLEEFGLPSTGGGERNCLLGQTLTSAGEKEVGDYLDTMIPLVVDYMEHTLAGRIQDAAACFSPGTCEILPPKEMADRK
ncbi:MAG: hypothetical protein KKD01_09085 [Proteobacteria bacterium]|nr:hypothetical protein [Pseudomonadota bacterium]MBU1139639.1 hypothetical protein [Pseudomonadota bacterium]MBU1233026.1 hypothetical protein [Pseudomonadota bacterium]MBU1420803.1 hypothetical protein [Pseudomonadota bacterium]MBU1454863.1 hypothetical protein [Pseudomonadota bacterium]